jgi:hypothetical protein
MKGIKKAQHGIADYLYVPLVSAAPKLFRFKNETAAANLCYILSASALSYSSLTNAPWGAAKLIPYKNHLALDMLAGVTTLSAPWLFKFSSNKRARNTFIVTGIISLVIGTLSLIGSVSSCEK